MDCLLAEQEYERLIIDFVRRLDLEQPSSVAELFTPDGVWEWPDDELRIEGREALRRYFGSRPSDRLSVRRRFSAVFRLPEWPPGRTLPILGCTMVVALLTRNSSYAMEGRNGRRSNRTGTPHGVTA